jgi:hypothetical protein
VGRKATGLSPLEADKAAGLPCQSSTFSKAVLCAVVTDEGADMKKQKTELFSRLNTPLYAKILVVAAVVLTFFILPVLAYSTEVMLAWDPNDEDDLAGYKIYYGTSSGNYSSSVDVGDTTEYTVAGLNDGVTYYFAATAYDTSDNESDYSVEVIYPGDNTHIITTTFGSTGHISPSGAVAVDHGADQRFKITPRPGYSVVDVLVDGVSKGVRSAYTFTNVSGDHSISASFALDNWSPIANAGPDQTVTKGRTVTLKGTYSADPDGSIVGYHWEQTAGYSVFFASPNAATATFRTPRVVYNGETMIFKLTVTDDGGLEDVDYCVINVIEDEVIDNDGDGVPDDEDDFPSDPEEWLDTDKDGIGNNVDEDDDDDGISDVWESQYGLNPLINDAAEDSDGDGDSNIDEYIAGTNPTDNYVNDAPYVPVVLAPDNNKLVGLTPVLLTEDFYDPDYGDSHLKTQWQIFDQLSDECVFDVETPTALTSATVPKLILEENTTYYWRVRFFDSNGTPSDWSESTGFLTDMNDEDSNGNGIPDHQELDESTDMDADGIPDDEQDDIKCAYSQGGKTFVGISVKGSPTVVALVSIAAEDPADILADYADDPLVPTWMPFDLLHFKLLMSEPGDKAVVTIYFSTEAPNRSGWYKYDPINLAWYDYSDDATFSPDKRSVTLLIKDGGFGDADGVENGIIVDPSGVGEDKGGGGSDIPGVSDLDAACFITTASYPLTDSGLKNMLHKIRGRELSILFILLLLVAGFWFWVQRFKVQGSAFKGSNNNALGLRFEAKIQK